VSTALNRLGLCQRDQGKYPNAIATLQRALAIRKADLPLDHPWVILSTNVLASAYMAARQPEDAAELLSKAKAERAAQPESIAVR
jgi:tetratricopeptide (TPR) repeat protein